MPDVLTGVRDLIDRREALSAELAAIDAQLEGLRAVLGSVRLPSQKVGRPKAPIRAELLDPSEPVKAAAARNGVTPKTVRDQRRRAAAGEPVGQRAIPPAQARILAALREYGPSSRRDVATAAGVGFASAGDHLAALKTLGLVDQAGLGPAAVWSLSALPATEPVETEADAAPSHDPLPSTAVLPRPTAGDRLNAILDRLRAAGGRATRTALNATVYDLGLLVERGLVRKVGADKNRAYELVNREGEATSPQEQRRNAAPAVSTAFLPERRCTRCLHRFRPTRTGEYVCANCLGRPARHDAPRKEAASGGELEVVFSGRDSLIGDAAGLGGSLAGESPIRR